MASTTLNRLKEEMTNNSSTPKLPTPPWRQPTLRDRLRFFIGIPLLLALVFSLVGIRLTHGMAYFDALAYMILHMFIAWWSVCLGATVIKLSLRSLRPPTITVCLMGVFIALIPAAFLFQALGDLYADFYPIFATNREDSVYPSWSLTYLLHFIRYSAPVLPTFLAGVYGYRYATGVDWYGYEPQVSKQETTTETGLTTTATAQLIKGSKLPDDARLIAIKADQHYIHIWSDQGNDLVRYRFSDLPNALRDCHGVQTHRSWWVNLNFVQSYKTSSRKMELIINDELNVPVSLSYKNAILALLNNN
ncbi:MAG: LytTR family transcriptional regulator [Gammaproteobacteria bacterium]|nr:LytTR family transcriptional regulator [Gammaproteobacteria bacterium]MCP4090809.1 LytTR family transcriptional regulator [Gammaproteobacteria bacterium]MCP4277236.1 LytTR family transcriptional regulator [Gammaproteobacteria bacterium]MCP4832858.1 LytTR family transcriptional regulator [Gammaproteobacteria bacterium]MCP4928957.1 LytTR family transcriptional regulator [Gammaproteobacteria bacterium]